MLDNFVGKLLAGKYSIQSKGEPPDHTSEQGDFLMLILAHDRITNDNSQKQKPKPRVHKQSNLATQLCENDGFNLPTLFGEIEDHTKYEFDTDDFKYSDLFDENGEVYADTLWSTVDHGAMTVQGEHGCLMSLFDVYTVSTIPSLYGILTVMSAPPSHHWGARPKITGPPSNVKCACVACEFSDFKTAHSLRHMIRVHNIACDTLVQGKPFPHVGYVVRRPNAREIHDFPHLIFPGGWAVNHRQDEDPESVSDRPPFGHRFVGVWPNLQCVPITNRDGSDNLFGLNRSSAVDTIAIRQLDRNIDRHIQMLKARSAGVKRQRESPGEDASRRY